MDFDAQKLLVKQFYEEHIDDFWEYMYDETSESSTFSFEKIASVQLGELSPLEVKMKKIDRWFVPQSIFNAFDRHLWYSQWNFAELFLIKSFIEKTSFFFIFHLGFSDDAWDSSDISLVEIFNEQGEFIYAIDNAGDPLNLKWKD